MKVPKHIGERGGIGAAAVAFGLALWWLAFFYLRGDLGVYSDDWAISMVDPVLGAPRWATWPFERDYFWRPALQLFVHYAFLLFWGQMWVFHLLNAAAHGVATLLLYRLLRRLGLIEIASFAGSMVFMLFPYNYEVVFWATAMTTGISTGLAIVMCLMTVRYARGEWRGARAVCGLGAMSFFIMCWYEQPGSIAAALPCLYMAARPPGERLGASAKRMMAMLLACGVGLATYLALLRLTAPSYERGGSQSVVALWEMPDRWREFSRALRWSYSGRLAEIIDGGVRTGWVTLSNFAGSLALALVVACGIAFLVRACRADVKPMALDPAERREARTRWLWTVAFGAVAFGAGWVPIFLIRGQIFEARMGYFASAGTGVVVAAILHGLLRSTRRLRVWPALRAGTMLAVCACLMVGAVVMVGWQSVVQRRTRGDRNQLGQLAAMFGDAPAGTVFMALEDSFTPGTSGRPSFDRVLMGWACAHWSATPALQYAMRRRDVFATVCNPWTPPAFREIDQAGLRYPILGFPGLEAHPEGGTRLAWSGVVPFMIDGAGNVRVISRLDIDRGDGSVITLEPALTRPTGQALRRAGTIAFRWNAQR